jgi:cation transporter-like permease
VEFYLQAHNELLQLAYEGGLVAVILLTAWGLAHRAVWGAGARRDQAALLALAVLSLTWFPFHVPTLAVVAVTIVGVALPLGPDTVGRPARAEIEDTAPVPEWAEISARIRGRTS